MNAATPRQEQILHFIQQRQRQGLTPTVREIARHFRFRSPRTVSDHLDALRRKGLLTTERGVARSFQIVSHLSSLRKRVVDIPVFGSIPAGFADRKEQEAEGCISVDMETVGLKTVSSQTFALKVQGDSMIGKHILEGDFVVLEYKKTPRNGDIVAALIDGESTLKTYVANGNKPYLKAENPKYPPKMIPAAELVIDGVVVAVIRKLK